MSSARAIAEAMATVLPHPEAYWRHALKHGWKSDFPRGFWNPCTALAHLGGRIFTSAELERGRAAVRPLRLRFHASELRVCPPFPATGFELFVVTVRHCLKRSVISGHSFNRQGQEIENAVKYGRYNRQIVISGIVISGFDCIGHCQFQLTRPHSHYKHSATMLMWTSIFFFFYTYGGNKVFCLKCTKELGWRKKKAIPYTQWKIRHLFFPLNPMSLLTTWLSMPIPINTSLWMIANSYFSTFRPHSDG